MPPIAGDQSFLKQLNRTAVVRVVRGQPGITRGEIAARTGLTKATVGDLVSDLVSDGWLREGETYTRRSPGRRAQALYPDGKVHALLGAEVAVDYLNVVATDISGHLLHREYREYRPSIPGETAAELTAMLRRAVGQGAVRGRTLLGVGVSVPGPVDPDTGILNVAPNIGWRNLPFLELLRERLPDLADVWVLENDGNASVLGEYSFGEGEKPPLLVHLILGSGLGCGVMIEGRVLRGVGGYGGEIGHTTLRPDGPGCRCGNRGCAELYVSERALSLELTAGDTDDLSMDRIAELVGHGGQQALRKVGCSLGLLMANVIHSFGPSDVIIGGPLARLGDALLDPAMAELARRVPAELMRHTRISLSRAGVDAAAVGAAAAALEAHLNPSSARPPPRAMGAAVGQT